MVFKVKTDAEGKALPIKDGKVTFVKDDGTDIELDVESTYKTVGTLRGESAERREKLEAAEGQLKAWEGVDVKEAKAALETVKAFTGKQALSAEELARNRAEAAQAIEDKYKPLNGEVTTLRTQLQQVTVGHSFANSKFVKEKIAEYVPVDMLQNTFGGNFEMKDGVLIAKMGVNQIYSPSDPSKLASFDEALEVMVGAYPNKAQILRGSGANGSGSNGGGGGNGGGKPSITRGQFEALGAHERVEALKTSTITD